MIDRLLQTGAMEGPYKRTKPILIPTIRQRFVWALLDVRDFFQDAQFAISGLRSAWMFARHMRRGGNPDQLPF